MNPIDSFKKWFLNKLVPVIENKATKDSNVEDLLKNGEPETSTTPAENKYEQYSELLEDSEYPEG